MKLREAKLEDEKIIREMYEEYMSNDPIPGIDRFEGLRDLEKLEEKSFKEWIDDLEKGKDEKNLPSTYSPHTLYLAINDEEKLVGAIGLRWKMVPALITFGGLIGYSIRPSERGKGYASEMLKLGLEKFKNAEINNVLISCKDFNIASKKVIEKNGGVFEDVYINKEDGYNYLRYWIEV